MYNSLLRSFRVWFIALRRRLFHYIRRHKVQNAICALINQQQQVYYAPASFFASRRPRFRRATVAVNGDGFLFFICRPPFGNSTVECVRRGWKEQRVVGLKQDSLQLITAAGMLLCDFSYPILFYLNRNVEIKL